MPNYSFRTLASTHSHRTIGDELRNLVMTISDSLVISHTSTQKIEYKIRVFTDSLTLADVRSRLRNKMRSSTDTVTLIDTRLRIKSRLKAISDSIVLSSDTIRIRNKIRTINDNNIVFSSVANRLRHLNQTISGEGITLLSTVTRLKNIVKSRTDSVSISESIQNSIGLLASISDTLSLGSVNSTVRNRIRTLDNQIISLLDTMIRQRLLQRQITQSLNLSEITIKTTSRLRTLTDNLNLSSITSATKLKLRQFQQTLSLVDAATKAIPYRIRSFSDSLTLAPATITKIINKMRGLSDSFILNLQLRRERGIIRLLQESLELLISSSRTATNRNRVISDTLGFGIGIGSVLHRLRMVTHGLTLNDMVETGNAKVKIILDQLNLDGQVTRLQVIVRSLQDNIQLGSETNGLTTKLRTITDNINFVDSWEKVKLRLGLVSHELAFSSTSLRSVDRIKSSFHNVSISSHPEGIKDKIRQISHMLSFQDSSSNSILNYLIKTIGESVSFGASSVRLRAKRVTVIESLNITSITEKAKEFMVKVLPIQVISFTESVSTRKDRIRYMAIQNVVFTDTILNSIKAAIKSFHLKLSRYKLYRY